jgi:hypothetical protein
VGRPDRPPASATRWPVVIGGAALLFLLLFGRSMTRPLNHDEHQFVAPAALLTGGGFLPYRDYPYFHMPNQVLLYAALTWWTPHKLLVARAVQVLCGTIVVVLVGVTAWRLLAVMEPIGRGLTTGGLLLALVSSRFFTYGSGLAWNHEASTLCALAALLLHLRGLGTSHRASLGVAGLLLGCATGIRLTFAPLAVPFLLSLWLTLADDRRRGTLVWGTGFAVGVLPAALLFLAGPAQFVFGNWGFPRLAVLAYPDAKRPTLAGKLAYFGVRFIGEPADAALLALFLVGAAAVAWRARTRRGPHHRALWLTLAVLAALVPGVLAPAMPNRQYAYPLLPFMVLAISYALAAAPGWPSVRWTRLTAAALIVVGASGAPDKYEASDMATLLTPGRWTPMRVHEVGDRIRAATFPGALVLTLSPIPPVEAGLGVYPEFATGVFAWRHASDLSRRDRARYQMISPAELEGVLAARAPDAVFVYPRNSIAQALVDYARSRGYRLVDPTDVTQELWVRPGR